jgi:glycerophosphoryl diester phosphodiesterase
MMESKPYVWAHRGASGLAPENTLAAFSLAEQLGADGIELDVHLSRDGVPVVMHDETVDRTTDYRGAIADFSLSTLQTLDAGRWFDRKFAGEPVPTLAEVLSWADNRLRLNIEIKSPQAGRAVLELLSEYPKAEVLISSFQHGLLFSLREWSIDLPLAFLTESCFWRVALKRAVACRAESFHPPAEHVSRMLINACHRHGLAVYPWTVDDESQYRNLVRMGVDGVFTNLPNRISCIW